MDYLVASLLVGLIMIVFLCILSIFENEVWSGTKPRPSSSGLQRLFDKRRTY
ncbi:MAG: hypothetical protein ABSE73_06220 [Planctomycetota bacterium]